ncbi:MAG: hypothetical protein ACLVES_07990 [Faecalibacterium prausnitzii]
MPAQQQRLLAAMLREPRYIDMVQRAADGRNSSCSRSRRSCTKPCSAAGEEGVEISLATLRAFVSEEALNELSRLAAQYSDVNCTPDDIRLYLDRIARGMPVASKAAPVCQ